MRTREGKYNIEIDILQHHIEKIGGSLDYEKNRPLGFVRRGRGEMGKCNSFYVGIVVI